MGSLRSVALALMLVSLVPCSICAASTPQEQSATRVILAKTAAPPGGKVVLPIYLTPAEGKEIGSVTLKLAFPGKTLKFGSVELVGIAEQAGATVKTNQTASGDQEVLEITIATPEKAGVRAALPSGSLAYVTSELSPEATVGTVVPLKVEATAAATTSEVGAVKVETGDSEVTVSDPGVIACFFYMH